MGIRWNDGKKQYIKDDGSAVTDKELKSLLKLHLEDGKTRVNQIGEKLLTQKISLLEWQLRTREELKELHLANLLLARGGKNNVTSKDYAELGRTLKNEYKHLRDFTKDLNRGYNIKNGQNYEITKKGFFDRLNKYVKASEISYEKGLKNNHIETDYKYAQRFLNSTTPCVECSSYAALGVIDIVELILPKEACSCGSRCKCTVEYYTDKP
jgi:hypothetical protein